MKQKHIHKILTGVLLAALVLGGCGAAAEPKAFGSLDGLTVTATQDWAPVEDTQSLYEAHIEAVENNGIDLALADKKGHYFSIEQYDCKEQLEDLTRLASELRQQAAIQGEEGLAQNLKAQGVDDAALAQYQTLWQCPEGEEAALFRSLADEAWQKQMAEASQNYAIISQEPVTLLDNETVLYEYRYTNNSKQTIHGYEAAVVWQNKLYNLSAWTSEKQFAKSNEQLKAMIQSVSPAAL